MRPTALGVLALLLVASAVRAQGRPDRLKELKAEFHSLEPKGLYGSLGPAKARLRVLRQILQRREDDTVHFVADVVRDRVHEDIHEDLIRLLAEERPEHEAVVELFRDRLAPNAPHRSLARGFLLRWARDKGDFSVALDLMKKGTIEDRFAALRILGSMSHSSTLAHAGALLKADWRTDRESGVSCAAIAHSLSELEGREAARLLLLLKRDPRFADEDAAAVRDATRLWQKPDLASYIEVGDLNADDVEKRKEMARFLGEAGIEAARLPLLKLARRRSEPPELRAAAAEALGGMQLSRADLAVQLGRLLEDEDAMVRAAAVRGLARLRVRPSAERLVEELDGPLGREVRRALSRVHGRPADSDWREWLKKHRQALPDGA